MYNFEIYLLQGHFQYANAMMISRPKYFKIKSKISICRPHGQTNSIFGILCLFSIAREMEFFFFFFLMWMPIERLAIENRKRHSGPWQKMNINLFYFYSIRYYSIIDVRQIFDNYLIKNLHESLRFTNIRISQRSFLPINIKAKLWKSSQTGYSIGGSD